MLPPMLSLRLKKHRSAEGDEPKNKCSKCEEKVSKCRVCTKRYTYLCYDHTIDQRVLIRQWACGRCCDFRLFWCHSCNKETYNTQSSGAYNAPINTVVKITGINPGAAAAAAPPKEKKVDVENEDEPSSSDEEEHLGKDDYKVTLCEDCSQLVDSEKQLASFQCGICEHNCSGTSFSFVITIRGTPELDKKKDGDDESSDYDPEDEERPLGPGQHRIRVCEICAAELGDYDVQY